MDGTPIKNKVDLKKVSIFILLAYALAWIPEFWYFFSGGTIDSGWFTLLAVGCMFAPAAAAIFIQKTIVKAPLSEIGLHYRFTKWYVIAIAIAITVTLLSIPISALLSESEFTNGLPFLIEQINKSSEIASSEKEMVIETLKEYGDWLPYIIVGASIIGASLVGPTLNAIPALGEELGWRGFLYKELKPVGFWTSSLIIGIVWGFWHLPLVIHGFNYPDAPVAGIFMMVLFTILLSPIFNHVLEKSGTVITAAAFHGTINAVAGLPLLFFLGASQMVIGINGLAGALVLSLANGIIFLRRKNMNLDTIN